MRIFIYISVVSCILLVGICISCEKPADVNAKVDQLAFSQDTVLFDTVFTTIGSATQELMVYNHSNSEITISEVRLARGTSSPYRMNVDGISAIIANNVEIAANDSIYIFINVLIDPTNHNNPLIQSDSILFTMNGTHKHVDLVAWGQDAWFHVNDTLRSDRTFTNEKPHVVYGNLVVENNANLQVISGTKLYFHKGSGIIVSKGSSLKVNGTFNSPVVFRSDNPDPDYDSVPGQWEGLRFMAGSGKHEINWAKIINARAGIEIDSIKKSGEPALRLWNTVIHNCTNYGLRAIGSDVEAGNCQVSNCGGILLSIERGGSYDFRQCTFANSWTFSVLLYPSEVLNNHVVNPVNGIMQFYDLTKAYFGNCIVFGQLREEVFADSKGTGLFNFTFDHCLVSSSLNLKYNSSFPNSLMNKSPFFLDFFHFDYRLTKNSPAIQAGSNSIINTSTFDLSHDLLNQFRDAGAAPDLGCYQFKAN